MINECKQLKRLKLDNDYNELECTHCKTCPLCPSLVCPKHPHHHCKICLKRTNWYKINSYNEKEYYCSIKCQNKI